MSTPQRSRLAAALNPNAPREMTPYERFRAQLNLVRADVAGLVGEKNVDRFVRVCLNAVQSNPDILAADRRTLLLACMKAAQDGLLPDGREAVFNVYKTKVKKEGREEWVPVVQYLPMSYGLIQKIYEAGASYVDAVPVYAKDDFDYQRGDEPKIVHKPYRGEDDPGSVIAAYVIVKLKTGETKREVMWKREIDRVREKSKAKDGLMWKEFYDQAAVKSVIHRVVKQLPTRSETLERTLRHDNEAVGLEEIDTPVEATGASLEALVDMRFETAARTVPAEPDLTAGARREDAAGGLANAAQDRHPSDTAAAPEPKRGEPGSPELKATILNRMTRADDTDVLDIIMDEWRFFSWDPADDQEAKKLYGARKSELGTGGSTKPRE